LSVADPGDDRVPYLLDGGVRWEGEANAQGFDSGGDQELVTSHGRAHEWDAGGHRGHDRSVPCVGDDKVHIWQHGAVRDEALGGDVCREAEVAG
jgi:hypothetical protein